MKYRNLSAIPAWLPFALALVVVAVIVWGAK